MQDFSLLVNLLVAVARLVRKPFFGEGAAAVCAPLIEKRNLLVSLSHREISGGRFSQQSILAKLPSEDGRPASNDAQIHNLADVPLSDARAQLLELWKDHDTIQKSWASGHLPEAESMSDLQNKIAGLSPAAIEASWRAFLLKLDLPLPLDIAEGDREAFDAERGRD